MWPLIPSNSVPCSLLSFLWTYSRKKGKTELCRAIACVKGTGRFGESRLRRQSKSEDTVANHSHLPYSGHPAAMISLLHLHMTAGNLSHILWHYLSSTTTTTPLNSDSSTLSECSLLIHTQDTIFDLYFRQFESSVLL